MNKEDLYKGIVSAMARLGVSKEVIQGKGDELLKSFCFLLASQPKYSKGQYIVVKNILLEKIPNKEIYAQISSVLVDYLKCEILYFVNYTLDGEFIYKVIKESQVECLQEESCLTRNFYGRDNMERFQYLQMHNRLEKVTGD